MVLSVGYLLLVPVRSNAMLLGSTDFSFFDGGGGSPTSMAVFLDFNGSPSGVPGCTGFCLFEGTVLTVADVGTTLMTTGAEPDFNDVVGILTNGVDDNISIAYLYLGTSSARAQTKTEASAFGGDFQGFDITGIGLRLNNLVFTGAGESNFNGIGSFTVLVEGNPIPEPSNPIPEPSTMLLLGSGLAGLAAWRRKKRPFI